MEEFEKVIEAAVEVQNQLPWLEMVCVGGTAASLHCHHRISTDADHVTPFLREKFQIVEDTVEHLSGWKTNQTRRPVLILGEYHNVEQGIRQLRRSVPIQKEQIQGLWVPTAPECLRIKAFLLHSRNAMRDFIDTAALIQKLGEEESIKALSYLNLLYPQNPEKENRTGITMFAQAVQNSPHDLDEEALLSYKGLIHPFNRWNLVESICQKMGGLILGEELENRLPQDLTRLR